MKTAHQIPLHVLIEANAALEAVADAPADQPFGERQRLAHRCARAHGALRFHLHQITQQIEVETRGGPEA